MMADSKSSGEQQKVKYLVQVLQRNPLEESDVIIRGRNRLLGLQRTVSQPSRVGADLEQTRQQRERSLQQVEQLRKIVWTASLEQLRTDLGAIRAQHYPDIQATVDRLSTIVAQRSQFPLLVEHPDFDADFFSTFKQVLASSPREVAILKERQIVAFGKAKRRRRGKKMISLLKKEQPALYALEVAWLDSLIRQKRSSIVTVASHSPHTASQSDLEEEHNGINIPWWVISFGLLALARILKAVGAFGD